MSIMSSLRRKVYGVPPYKGKRGRQWLKAQHEERKAIHERGVKILAKENAKKQEQRERRERLNENQITSLQG